jgi:uncharacterized protein (DUF305 family)
MTPRPGWMVNPARCAVVLMLAGAVPPPCVAAQQQTELPPGVVTHAEWESASPLGHAADATRRNLRPGGRLEFRDLAITVMGTDITAGDVDRARLRLTRGKQREERTVREGAAFNWQGYHIAIVAVYGPGELGAGLTAVEVATVESLTPEVASSTVAGGADLRLRIPHDITHVTLHHSGSAEPLRPEDDPVQKLRGLQSWGARDRNWWDVPYHFLIDLEGRVYEGRDWRYMGETNTTYDPRGHFLISVIGNYGRQEPTSAQVDAIAGLMAWALTRFDLPLDRIGGHYDYADTSCPGEHLIRYLEDGTFRRLVERRLGVPAPAARRPARTARGAPLGQAAADAPPSYGPADVRFVQHMIAHHEQAVVMANMVGQRTERADIHLLARRMDVSQQDEMRLLRRWLEKHGEPVPASLHAQHGQQEQPGDHVPMPGMLTTEELARLERSRGAEFDDLFLEYMIRHHEGALTMVAELFATPGAGQDPELYQLASHVDADQRAEIARMRRMQSAFDGAARQ